MKELVSIIIPVYNVEKYLSECLDSVINQTYQNLEILLIDDGSKDKSPLICDEYAKKDARIKVIHKENGGVSSARNLGLDIAKGEYITFIDSDDLVSKNYVEKLYINLKENNSDLSFCKYADFVDGEILSKDEVLPDTMIFNSQEKYADFVVRFLRLKDGIMTSSCRILYKKSLIAERRFNLEVKIGEDLLFVLAVVLNSKAVSFINEEMYYYRVNQNSVMHTYRKDFLKSQLVFQTLLQEILSKFNDKRVKSIFNNRSAHLGYQLFRNEILYKQPNRRANVKEIRKSSLYKYFKLRYGIVKTSPFINKKNFFITWVLVKIRLI